MQMDDLSLLVCSYNTPDITINLLKSWVKCNPKSWPTKILIAENSTNEDTATLLKSNEVPYMRFPGYTHSQGMNTLFTLCTSKYALLLDSDILFRNEVLSMFEYFKNTKLTMMGEYQGDRGGKKLHPRIAPWFCFVNMEELKKHDIIFNDVERMQTNNNTTDTKFDLIKYDVGSTMFEDIATKIGDPIKTIGNLSITNLFYIHAEGLSWHVNKFADKETDIDIGGTHNNKALYDIGVQTLEHYNGFVKGEYDDVKLSGMFV